MKTSIFSINKNINKIEYYTNVHFVDGLFDEPILSQRNSWKRNSYLAVTPYND